MEKKWERLQERFLKEPLSLNDDDLAYLHRRAAEEIKRLQNVEKLAKSVVAEDLEEGRTYDGHLLVLKDNGYSAPTFTWGDIVEADWELSDKVAFECLTLKLSEVEKVDKLLYTKITTSAEYFQRRTPKQKTIQWAITKENIKVKG